MTVKKFETKEIFLHLIEFTISSTIVQYHRLTLNYTIFTKQSKMIKYFEWF